MLIVSLKTAAIAVLYIPQASDVGISFNDALMAESLKKFLWVEGEFLFSLLSEPEIFEMQEWRGGIIDGLGLKYQELPDYGLIPDQVQQVLLYLCGIIKPKSH